MCIRFINKGGKAPKLQEKSVTITNNGTTNVIPDTGYDGLSEVGIITNVSGGGGGIPDWTQIGYNSTPQALLNEFAYSKQIYDDWDENETDLSSRFKNDLSLIYMPLVDTSNAININNMFNGCSNLTTIPQLDISNATNVAYVFANCTRLTTIPLLNTSNATTTVNMFNGCSNLTTIPQLDTSNVTNLNGIVSGCLSLSNESLNNLLNMCANSVVSSSTNKNLKKIGLTSEQATICQSLSNYQAFLNAGWTTGY